MPLTSGARIGHFEIEALLGEGGMGEVHRARDTRLDRVVAIKSVPEALARDAELRARFEREARLLASLNHPNIAGVYGLEAAEDSRYLVLEFVDGETLARRLSRGALPVRETLRIGSQIASAIEAAHERGIVHRDLKPGNVMVTGAGNVKVLDFGLAKGRPADEGFPTDLSATPTAAMISTAAGTILGTAPYMSPEQARGGEVDRRADVWAFGCVLYECLTGAQAFPGETASDTIARILERQPDWGAIPTSVPTRLKDLVRRCLTKDAAERPRDIGDLRRELDAIAAESETVRSASRASLPSLAVLYFENLSTDPESEYFCAGITEDILTDLSKIKGLRVASRNAVLGYRGATADIRRVAAELGVEAVLEGTARKSGNRVRITAQLVNAADGFHLWAERYDRTLDDVFAVQEGIASSIAGALRVALSPAESRDLVKDRPRDVRAYDLYLKGREAYNRYEPEQFQEALALFRRATEVDPSYALAWAGIADCQGQLAQYEAVPDIEGTLRLGLEAAEKAVALDPRLPEAYKAWALLLMVAGDMEGANAALHKALEVDPDFTPALTNLAVLAFTSAHIARAERLFRRAVDLDPQHAFAMGWLATLLLLVGRLDEAAGIVARMRVVSGVHLAYRVHSLTISACLARGDADAAERAIRTAAADGVRRDMASFEAVIALRGGRMDEARRLLSRLDEPPRGLHTLVAAATVAVALGQMDLAVRLMRRRLLRGFGPTAVRLYPELHPLLDHAPFAPRRSALSLVWPLEAPQIDAARHALFREVRIESGMPSGSDLSATN